MQIQLSNHEASEALRLLRWVKDAMPITAVQRRLLNRIAAKLNEGLAAEDIERGSFDL